MVHSETLTPPRKKNRSSDGALPETLIHIVKTGRIPNGLLLTGVEGTGKRTTAITLAKALNCQATLSDHPFSLACDQCRSCLKINDGMHPDIITVLPEKDRLKIGQIRDLLSIITTKPHEAKIRMVLIFEAQTMNAEAANALLKQLEEPPERTLFVLCAPDLNRLLPTVISRCCHIHFKPISAKTIADTLIEKKKISRERATIAARTSCGNLQKAMMFLNISNNDTEAIPWVNPTTTTSLSKKASSTESNVEKNFQNQTPPEVHWLNRRHWLLSGLFELLKPNTPRPVAVKSAIMTAEKLTKETDLLADSFLLIKLWFRDLAILASQNTHHIHPYQKPTPAVTKNQVKTEKKSLPTTLSDIYAAILINQDFIEPLTYLLKVLPPSYPLTTLENVHKVEQKLQSHASTRSILEGFFLSLLPPRPPDIST